MTTQNELQTALYNWLVLVTGFGPENIFRSEQNNPDRPNGTSWATFKIIAGESPDYPMWEKSPNPDHPLEQVDILRVNTGSTMVSINIYSENFADILKGLYLSRAERETRILFKDIGASLIDFSGVRDLTLLSDTNWKKRGQADFTFNTFSERTETDYILDDSDLTGYVEPEDINIVVNRN